MTTNTTSFLDSEAGLPPLDCHAHINVDVTQRQLDTLHQAEIFAVTRTLAEAHEATTRRDRHLTWGLGVHPGLPTARNTYDPELFRHLLPSFALVGEVGLDKRAPVAQQRSILSDVLSACQNEPVLISLHSTGQTSTILDLLDSAPHPGAVLHWWLGSAAETQRAVKQGTYFSVNAGMADERIAALPRDRVLPETDFPAKAVKSARPGDIRALERRLAALWNVNPEEARRQCWMNLRTLTTRCGAIDRVSDHLADLLLTA
jgi:TatD DNase family protein